ncbi:MAG: hypothetical protein JWM76_5134 [Pseudonocardiales bacterium]|nr:hypothetical protein [Pseudonocardiales bacterium]
MTVRPGVSRAKLGGMVSASHRPRPPIAEQQRVVAPSTLPPEEPYWEVSFAPRLSLSDNVRCIGRPLWGKAVSEWTMFLAEDVVARFPDADFGEAARGWAAGLLWVTALDIGLQRTPELWNEVLDDITSLTGTSRELAHERWLLLVQAGLTRPTNPPW